MLQKTLGATWYAPRLQGQPAMTQLTVEDAVLRHLLALAAGETGGASVREIAGHEVAQLKIWLEAKTDPKIPMLDTAHWASALQQIDDFQKNPQKYAAPVSPEVPPGQPIGSEDEE